MIKMKDKFRLILSLVLAISALAGLLFFIKSPGKLDVIEYSYSILILLILAGTSIILWKKAKDIKAGLPVEDELATKIAWKAGYYAYLFSVWVAVGLLWYNILIPKIFGVPELTVEQAIGIFVLLPGAFFIVAALYFNKKGDV